MNAWLALTKKEFQLNLPAFIIALVLFVGFMVGGYYVGNFFGYTNEVLLGVSLFASGVHAFLLTFYLFISLNTERKRMHLWLHNPMSISGLLSAKIFTSFIYMIITFAASITLSVLFFRNVMDIFNQQTMFNMTVTMIITLLFVSLFVAATFLLYWSIFLTFSKRMNDFLSFILTFIIFIIVSWAYGKFGDLSIIQTLTQWGEIQVQDIIVGFEFNFDFEEHTADGETFSEASILYIGEFIKETIEIAIMFLASCWIIEKKVEV